MSNMWMLINLLTYRTNWTYNVELLANDLGPEMQCYCDADQSGGEGKGGPMVSYILHFQ